MKPRSIGVSDIRDVNRKIVLRCIWKHQPVSRAEISVFTNINKATISEIVARLVRERLVVETPVSGTGVGRNPIGLLINGSRHLFYAIEFDIPESLIAIYDLSGKRIAAETVPTSRGKQAARLMVSKALTLLDTLAHGPDVPRAPLRAVGVSVPGVVDRKNGVVLSSQRLGWKNVPICRALNELTGRNVAITLDKNASSAMRAELVNGGALPDNVTGVFVEIGNEVDSAVVLDGKILRGYPYGSGSFGRSLLVISDGEGASRHEVWQDLVSVPALMTAFGAHGGADHESVVSFLRHVRERFHAGDAMALKTLKREAHLLATGFANIFLSLGLPEIVVGGSIRLIWDLIEEDVLAECERLTMGEFPRSRRIRLARIANNECLEGAALDAIGTVVPLELISQLSVQQKEAIEGIALEASEKGDGRSRFSAG